MTDLLKQRIAENQTHPYMAQHELVFEIIELEKKVIDLQKAISVLLSSEKPVAPASAALAPEPPVNDTEKE